MANKIQRGTYSNLLLDDKLAIGTQLVVPIKDEFINDEVASVALGTNNKIKVKGSDGIIRELANKEDIDETILQPWTDTITFTYNGSNNIQSLSFTPKVITGITSLQKTTILNPYYDFNYTDNTIVLKPELLTNGIEYIIITNYYK